MLIHPFCILPAVGRGSLKLPELDFHRVRAIHHAACPLYLAGNMSEVYSAYVALAGVKKHRHSWGATAHAFGREIVKK